MRKILYTTVLIANLSACGGSENQQRQNLTQEPAWNAVFPDGPVIEPHDISKTTLHAEYPSFHIDALGRPHVLLTKFDETGRWVLIDALVSRSPGAPDSISQFNIINFSGTKRYFGNAAWPNVTLYRGRYLMVFSAATEFASSYDAIFIAQSDDGISWEEPIKIYSGAAYDPTFLPPTPSRPSVRLVFTKNQVASKLNSVNLIESRDLTNWSNAREVWSNYSNLETGAYTLAATQLRSKTIVFIETGDRISNDLNAYCFNDHDSLTLIQQSLFHGQNSDSPQSIKYGFWIPSAIDPAKATTILYNGIKTFGAEQGGSIFSQHWIFNPTDEQLLSCQQ